MPREVVFVNYRQNGTRNKVSERLPHVQVVEAVVERLRRHFGPHQVFLDTGMRAGEHYPDALRRELHSSTLLVVVMHREWWRDLQDRLDKDEDDWVRYEIGTALEEGKHILPVLIDNAGLPDPAALPEDIRPFAYKQLRRISFGNWERDVRTLIQEVEGFLSPTELPERVAPRISRPRKWPELPTAWLLGAAALLAGVFAFLPTTGLRAVWLAALAGASVFALFVPAATLGTTYAARKFVDGLDHESTALPRDLKVNVIVGLVITALAIFVLLTDRVLDPRARMLMVAVVVGIVITMGVPWLRTYRAARAWPQPELKVNPASVRGALDDVTRHLVEHSPSLNRIQRDKAYYVLDQVGETLTVLRELANRKRITWLRAASPWLTLPHAFLVGAGTSAAVAALGVYWATGRSHWSAPVWCAAGVLSCVLLYLAAIEAAYRLQRWRRLVVLEDAPTRIAELRAQVDEASIPPPPRMPRNPVPGTDAENESGSDG
ncbi:TIR domain-containing protein [Saccharothrix longispora]|uniref:TIR domain-containing protein n=1 Tax=Saccharothrix longispora TaxID=33920 RepID=A0ABU1Q6A0_9PSEU|nr:TIR domain-containing protein [Saccharothrix longispora]MDR6598422.1 hypothetical protein [Saccharothrix longispora]